MAGKHYIIATNDGYILNDAGYAQEFHSKEAAAKELASIVREDAAACRRSYKTCSILGSARKGSVQIRVGGRQGFHLWQRYVINERAGARKPPRARVEEKKTKAQLDAEIAEVLSGSGGGAVAHSTIATRNYEYVVYPEPSHRHAERSVKIPTRPGKGPYDLTDAKREAKQLGSPAAIYSVSKGRFVGYVHPNGRYVTFR